MEIRQLTANDVSIYREVRLRSLREHPEAFGASFEEEQALTVEQLAQQLSGDSAWVFGAFLDARLVGIVSLVRYGRAKTCHRAILGGMYVASEARGQGLGKALLAHTIEQARALDGLEDLTLAVTVGNAGARALYLAAGFVPYGVEPRYIKLHDCYFDIEWMTLRLSGVSQQRN
jgi:RimJ/RimL family protein N-acetyltransferase